MEIKCVQNGTELINVLTFVKETFKKINYNISDEDYTVSYDFWIDKVERKSPLLLYALDINKIISSIFGWIDNDNITISHVCTDEDYRGKGIGKLLMDNMGKQIKILGYKFITLGALETAEGFYENLGFKGSLLIQSEKHSIDELLSLNNIYKVAWTNVYDNKINQICILLIKADRELQKKYEKTFVGCNTQMIFQKSIE